MKPITAIVVGAGLRGALSYAPYALAMPNELQIVGVAEPDAERRLQFKQQHNIPDSHCFESWEQILELPKLADAALICTQDQMHFEPSMLALDKGYHLLLEKPIAPTAEECLAIAKKANEKSLHVVVCHVLRYTTLFKTLHELITADRIGQIMAINHNENVNHIHHSHSFVRGNWRNTATSNPMILAKCCHDLDIIQWLANEECLKVSSFGSLAYFTEKNAPVDAPKHCMDGCPHSDTCPYDAATVYVKEKKWSASAFCTEPHNTTKVLEALRSNDYGRCVFRCDNNVVDHQIVTLEYKSGLTVSLTMSAFTTDFTRTIKIMGTKGEMRILFNNTPVIELYDFISGRKDVIYPAATTSGHGGGDFGIMKDFVKLLSTGVKSPSLTSIDLSVSSHILAFAAEESRLSGETVHLSRHES